MMNRACHAAASDARLDKRVSMHTSRYSFATHLLEENRRPPYRVSKPRPAQGDVSDPGLPDGDFRLPCRALRRLRPCRDRLQFLLQPPLPEVPGAAASDWLADRRADLLPVPYYHVASPCGRHRRHRFPAVCHHQDRHLMIAAASFAPKDDCRSYRADPVAAVLSGPRFPPQEVFQRRPHCRRTSRCIVRHPKTFGVCRKTNISSNGRGRRKANRRLSLICCPASRDDLQVGRTEATLPASSMMQFVVAPPTLRSTW